jgi:hypothetical protein
MLMIDLAKDRFAKTSILRVIEHPVINGLLNNSIINIDRLSFLNEVKRI